MNRRDRHSGSPSRSLAPKWAASEANHGSARHSSTTPNSGHTERSGNHGSVSVSMPAAAATTAPISRPGKGKVEVGAHTVAPKGRGAQAGRQALGQPALDAACRHRHDFGHQRIGEGRLDDITQCLDEAVGPLCSVKVQHAIILSGASMPHRCDRLD